MMYDKKAADRAYYQANREKRMAYIAAWVKAHPEKRREYQVRDRAKHLEKRRATERAWKLRHPFMTRSVKERDGNKRRNAEWRKKNPLGYRQWAERENRENPERLRARRKRGYESWKKKPTTAEDRRVRRNRYVSLARANGGVYSRTEWREKVALLGGVCFYCGEAKPLGPDHTIPVSRGGRSDISNIVPACISCNMRKGAQTAREFLGLAS